MTNLHQPEDVAVKNEKSLKALVRATTLSQGHFSLILARCNYATVRDRIVQRLRELSPIKIRELVLPESVKTLYTTIEAELGSEQPTALMVFGLDAVSDLSSVLTSSNYVREEFRKNFQFPLVLWINNDVLKKLIRLAPDFENWATITEFAIATHELLNMVWQKVEQILAIDATINLENCSELEAAFKDLQNLEPLLEPGIQASLEFLRGLDNYRNNQIEAALEHYQKSLELWPPNNPLEWQGILLLNIALCYHSKAEQNWGESRRYWQETRHYLQQCVALFEQAQRLDLVAHCMSKLPEVLKCLPQPNLH